MLNNDQIERFWPTCYGVLPGVPLLMAVSAVSTYVLLNILNCNSTSFQILLWCPFLTQVVMRACTGHSLVRSGCVRVSHKSKCLWNFRTLIFHWRIWSRHINYPTFLIFFPFFNCPLAEMQEKVCFKGCCLSDNEIRFYSLKEDH